MPLRKRGHLFMGFVTRRPTGAGARCPRFQYVARAEAAVARNVALPLRLQEMVEMARLDGKARTVKQKDVGSRPHLHLPVQRGMAQRAERRHWVSAART